jgi:hypothetical protein
VVIAEVIAVVVFAGEWLLGPAAFMVVARETLFLIPVVLPVVALKISWPAEHVYFRVANRWIQAGILVLLEPP